MKNLTICCIVLASSLGALLKRPATGTAGRCSFIQPGKRPNHKELAAAPAQDHHERGDVPGWVMITLMSAVLVAALLALAGPALESMFNQAMDKVGS